MVYQELEVKLGLMASPPLLQLLVLKGFEVIRRACGVPCRSTVFQELEAIVARVMPHPHPRAEDIPSVHVILELVVLLGLVALQEVIMGPPPPPPGSWNYIIITIEDSDTDDDDDDDDDVVLIEDSEAENTDNSISNDDMLAIESDFQDEHDNSPQPTQIYGATGLPLLDDQIVSQMNHPENLKRFSPSSEEVDFIPSYKRGRSSSPTENNMLKNVLPVQVPGTAESNLENNPRATNCPHVPGNESDQCPSSAPVSPPPNFVVEKFILIEVPGNTENSQGTNSQPMYYPALLGNMSGPNTDTSSHTVRSNFALEKVLLIETPEGAEASPENNPQTMHYPDALGDGSGPGTTSSSHSSPPNSGFCVNISLHFSGIMPKRTETGAYGDESRTEVNSETTAEEVNSDQDADSQSSFFNPNMVCLGDPRRNVRILNTYLLMAQRKSKPKLAACYLVRILFSREVLMCSSVSGHHHGNPPLDPNKIAAIREYLTTVFPNHDLRECGKDWKACIADINALIRCLSSDSKKILVKTSEDNKDSPKPKCSGFNDKRDSGAGCSHWCQRAAASGIRDNGNFQPHCSALPEGIEGPSTENSADTFEALDYFGARYRNILLPCSVMKIAKGKPRPELSARYLIRKLFSEDVLIRSNVYGNPELGMCALNYNRISALREFLQAAYPTCDLSEGGYDWKLCVTAINSCIRSLRYDHRRSMSKSQPTAAAATSTEPKPRDDDSSDRST
ncbi:PREDICTED: BEN domain-containing protein 2 [Condylura cristata]|uniref:BEN domain-containing protein 2 n=1 Tax=Condylura cristata TaxID=143302 RepID=UPI000642BB88|nr:PREDICTED: BEN domain-containing protein 2 [Condylura cristata]